MRRGIDAILGFTLVVLGAGTLWSQAPKPPSLKEQLEAQYQQPGTVLVIQKEGILGVPSTSKATCAAKYQDHKLKTPDASCPAPLRNSSKPFTVGEKVNLLKIEVDEAKGKISFRIGECDACNNVTFSSRVSQIDFQFADLKKASVSEVEDTINQVLSFDESADQQTQPVQDSQAVEGQQGGASSGVLTNRDVMKMVKANLPDGIILRKIKSSACKFDTSVDALGELKKAGVSEPVINAMLDADEASKTAAKEPAPVPSSETETTPGGDPPPPTVPGQSFSVRHRHSNAAGWFVQGAQTEYYCSGTLSVPGDGTVAYDCAQTDDPSGRCEQVSFAPGSLKQVKIGFAGNLHLESKTQGKFDFYGDRNDIKQAQAAIAPLIQTTQK